tara:strand:+ start:244 stop:1098 length:855 start_codon:yes stop_codon:yes gene_type:complete
MPYYAVINGKVPGIYQTWDECKTQIYKFPNAQFKKFSTLAEAETYLASSDNDHTLQEEIDEFTPDFYIYTDGCCINNGQENSKAGIGIYFGKEDPRNVSREIIGKKTNNIAELTAILETYNIIRDDILNNKKIMFMTDSTYSIHCIGPYGKRMNDMNWTKNIPNKDLVKKVFDIYHNLDNVKFAHIKAHTNKQDIHSLGNSMADYLANMSVGLTECPYQEKTPVSVNNMDIAKNLLSGRTYLKVPFRKKDDVKSKGCIWDFDKKQWYVRSDNKYRMKLMTKYLR